VAVVVWLDEVSAADAPEVGGKAASLGELIAAGLPVPPGFAVTTTAYTSSRDTAGHGRDIATLLAGVDSQDLDALSRVSQSVRSIVAEFPIPDQVEAAIRSAYARLGSQAGDLLLPVAVRSSARGEDSLDASFAGEHDTFLWLTGADDVIEAVRRCWTSLFTDRAVSYRAEMGLEHSSLAMGVVVQAMVRPTSAGVAFTLNPSNGDRSVVAIDSAWGFGEGVVSGEVTPDSFLVDKVMNAIVSRVVSTKEHEFVLVDGDRVARADLAPERASTSSLTDEQVMEIAGLARRAERHARCPQDVEWALVRGADGESSIVLLQTRPETVWSRLDTDGVAGARSDDRMSSIVSTLLSPLHAQQED